MAVNPVTFAPSYCTMIQAVSRLLLMPMAPSVTPRTMIFAAHSARLQYSLWV